MDHELFNTGLNVWQAALAVFSLATGAGTGAVASARMRMHFDDRRVVVDRLIPDVRALSYKVPLEVGKLALACRELDRRVHLLPWIDRSAWRRARRQAPLSIEQARTIAAGMEPDNSITEAFLSGQTERTIAEVQASWVDWQRGGEGDGFAGLRRFDAELRAFSQHLHRSLRTGVVRRLRSLPHRLDHYTRGPWLV